MPRPGVSHDDVAEAIHALRNAGINPSIRLIREKLGKGSLSTIAEHKRAVDAEQSEGPGPALPDAVARGLLRGAEAYWQELVEAAEAEIAGVRANAAASEAAVNAKLETAELQVAELNETLGKEVAATEHLKGALATREASLTDAETALRAKEVEFSRATAERESLAAQLSALKSALEERDLAMTQAVRDSARLAERLEHQAADHARVQAALAQRARELEAHATTLAERLDEAGTAVATAEQRGRVRDAECAGLTRELTELRGENRTLSGERGALQAEIVAAQETLANERRATERIVLEKDRRAADLEAASAEAQRLVRQSVGADRKLVQALLAERRTDEDRS